MSVQEHDLEIVSAFLDDGWTPVCSCGWEGSACETSPDAVEEWENHCDSVFYEATS